MNVLDPDLPPADPPSTTTEPHHLDGEEVLRQLHTPAESGLSDADAARRLQVHGPNQLTEAPRPSFWQLLWGQFNNFVIILLVVAAVISALLGDWVEAGAIMAIVVLNSALGVIQERRAEEALAALRRLAAPEAHVIRGGHHQTVPARDLVPGDLVILEAGNYIPSDVRLLEAVNLRVEEAALTGESVPVHKDAAVRLEGDIPLGDRKNTAFMGTLVSYGRGRGVVVATGMQTEIGKIATMLQAVQEEDTPLQKRLDQLGRTLGWAALAVCGLVFAFGLLRGTEPLEMFLLAVTLAIAAVPEGLPAVVTISLALGMREMIKRNALIRRLSSVETLGSATVIGSDKTGTLTQNEMTVTRMWVDGHFFEVGGDGYTLEGEFQHRGSRVDLARYPAALSALWVGVLNNDAELESIEGGNGQKAFRIVGDPTEGSLLVAAAKAGAWPESLKQAFPREQEIPFDSERKRMVTLHGLQEAQPDDISPFYDRDRSAWHAVTVKGAPDVVLEQCSYYARMDDKPLLLDDTHRQEIQDAVDEMTQEALRVLALAYQVRPDLPDEEVLDSVEKELIFVGLIGMIDPPRQEVPAALEIASRAGLRTVMITGDYPRTARAIAASIGLLQPGRQVLTGHDLNQMDDEELGRQVADTDVFARVSPQHKVRIVDALRARGEVVAMTGDGVNDAPALKHADIGVAMGITGTDVAKETADMVLTDDNYASIVAAVEQGRVIYSNIRKFVFYLLSCNLAEIAVIFLATVAGLPSPLTPIQLLWLNLVTDGAPALALGTEKGDPDIMSQPPRPPSEPIINRLMRTGIIVQTLAITAVTLGAYLIGLSLFPGDPAPAKTMAFMTLSASELLRAYTARSERYPLLGIGVFSNTNMNIAVVSSLALLLAVVYVPFLQPIFNTTPLSLAQWQVMLPLLFVPSLAAEITKRVVSKA